MPEQEATGTSPVDPLRELVRDAAGGDVAAQRTVLAALGLGLLQVIRTVLGVTRPEVEDVLQDAMVAVHRALPSFRGECTTLHFGCRVALMTAMNARRRLAYRSCYTPASAPTGGTENAFNAGGTGDASSSGGTADASSTGAQLPDAHAGASAVGGDGTDAGGVDAGGSPPGSGGATGGGDSGGTGAVETGGALPTGGGGALLTGGSGGVVSLGGAGGVHSTGGAGGVPPTGGAGGGVNCNCMLGGYEPACGVDGVTYDAICGLECAPVPIACMGMCPCATGNGGAGGLSSGGAGGASTFECDTLQCTRDQYCLYYIPGAGGSPGYSCPSLGGCTDCECLALGFDCICSQGNDGSIHAQCQGV